MKPRILIDVKSGSYRQKVRQIKPRINLSYKSTIFVPIKFLVSEVFISAAVLSFVFSLAVAPTGSNSILRFDVSMAAQNEEARKQLEAQLVQLESQISQYETTIDQYRKQGKNLQSEIKKLEAQIAKLSLQIRAINLSISRLDQEITVTQGQIAETEQTINLNKKNLSQILQTLYENDKKGLMEVLLVNPQLSDFFADLNNLLAVQDNLRVVIGKIIEERDKLVDQKETLALERSDAATLKAYQDAQRANIQKNQAEKNNLLQTTKGKESEYQKLLTETKKTAAETRKQIFKLLGGGELEFEEAYNLAKLAEKATGVRAALILAVLDRESALGKNVGQCNYQTAMHPTRDIPVFLTIVGELGLRGNLNSGALKVSCPNADGAYGGAMGPAQFIPSTWKLYKARIAEITGNNPPSPWRNADAFVATALYLKDVGAGGNTSLAKEREAAARYYAGSRWKNYLWTYGERVISLAGKFEDDIAILGG